MKTKLVLIGLVTCLFFLVNGVFAEEQKKSEKNKPTSNAVVEQKAPKNSVSTSSESVEQKKDQQNCQDQIKVKVKGMVCDYCVGALTKVFKKQSGYAGLDVDLEAGHVILSMQPGKTLKDETIKTLIKDAGYNVKSIHKGCDS